MVCEFVKLLSFANKNYYFEMLCLVEVVVHGIPVYMVQKNRVDKSHDRLMIIITVVYNKLFVVSFYFVENMGKFHSDLVNFVGSHETLLNLMMVLENLIFLKKVISRIFTRGLSCLWSIDIIIIMFCKIISSECFSFL